MNALTKLPMFKQNGPTTLVCGVLLIWDLRFGPPLFCSGLFCGPWSVFRPCFLALASLNKIAVYQKVKKSKERSEERGSLKKLKLVLHYWLKTRMDKKSGVNHMELWIEFGCMDIAPYNNFNVFEKLFSEFPISVGQSENNFNFFNIFDGQLR